MRRTEIAAAALTLAAAVTLTGCGSRKAFGKEQETMQGHAEEETEAPWASGEEETEMSWASGGEETEMSWESGREETEMSWASGGEETEMSREYSGEEAEATVYWSIAVEDYKVSLQDDIPDASLKLVLRQGSIEKVLQTYEKGKNYNSPEEFTADTFERLLGHSGFCVYEDYDNFGYLTNYYAIEDGELVGLAASWTLPDGAESGPTDHMIDLDGDGDRELICNVMYLADGACRTLIYRYDNGLILRGFADDLLDEECDSDAANYLGTEYLPEKEVIRIWYPSKDEQGAFAEKEYAVDLSKVAMEPYEDVAWW